MKKCILLVSLLGIFSVNLATWGHDLNVTAAPASLSLCPTTIGFNVYGNNFGFLIYTNRGKLGTFIGFGLVGPDGLLYFPSKLPQEMPYLGYAPSACQVASSETGGHSFMLVYSSVDGSVLHYDFVNWNNNATWTHTNDNNEIYGTGLHPTICYVGKVHNEPEHIGDEKIMEVHMDPQRELWSSLFYVSYPKYPDLNSIDVEPYSSRDMGVKGINPSIAAMNFNTVDPADNYCIDVHQDSDGSNRLYYDIIDPNGKAIVKNVYYADGCDPHICRMSDSSWIQNKFLEVHETDKKGEHSLKGKKFYVMLDKQGIPTVGQYYWDFDLGDEGRYPTVCSLNNNKYCEIHMAADAGNYELYSNIKDIDF